MTPGYLKLTIFRGSPVAETLTFRTSEGVAVDLSGLGPWKAQVRKKPNSTPVLLELTVDATNAATGVLVLSATSADTQPILITDDGATPAAAWDLLDATGTKWVMGPTSITDNITQP